MLIISSLFTNVTIEKLKKEKDHFSVLTNDGKELIADAVVVATGFDLFKSSRKEEYGYGIYDNVITSADLEEMFKKGEIVKSDGTVPAEYRNCTLCRIA